MTTDHELKANRSLHSFEQWTESHNGADPWLHVASQLGAGSDILIEGSARHRLTEFTERAEADIWPEHAAKLADLRAKVGTVDKPSEMAIDAPSLHRMRELEHRHGERGTKWTQYEMVAVVRAETYGEPHRLMIVSLEDNDA